MQELSECLVQPGKLDINRGKGNSDQGRGREREVHELSVFYTNSRSVINKIDALRGIACVEELDIIGTYYRNLVRYCRQTFLI